MNKRMIRSAGGEMSNGMINKVERKTIEKNRRIQMKGLCWKMVNLIPQTHFTQPKLQEVLSQQDQVEQAAGYIQQLSARIEELKQKKTQLADLMSISSTTTRTTSSKYLPILRLREMGCSSNNILEVILISGIRRNFMICEAISILEQEGAEVVTLNISNMGHKIFHTLHAKVKFSRIGVDTSRIGGRLQELISSS